MGLLAAAAHTNLGYDHRRIAQDSERVTATVTNVGWTRFEGGRLQASGVYITYEIDGTLIRAQYEGTTSRTHMDVLVSRQNPHEFVRPFASYWVYAGALLALMVVFAGAGVWSLVAGKRVSQWLEGYGTPALADVRGALKHWCVKI